MAFGIRYAQSATQDLSALDQTTSQRIATKIRHYCSTDKPLTFAIALHGGLKGHYRFRIGEYRAIFILENNVMITICVIERIKHRKEVYE